MGLSLFSLTDRDELIDRSFFSRGPQLGSTRTPYVIVALATEEMPVVIL
jgi:hypothetical protein